MVKAAKPQIIIIRGPVGSGKTSVVESLRKHLENVSIVDYDGFKRQIDNTQSSEWRRELALDTALFLTERLMLLRRTIVIDIHASFPEHLEQYAVIARKHGYTLTSYLLYPSLSTCLRRARQRNVADIEYTIDAAMVKKYWYGVKRIPGETVFDKPHTSVQSITHQIVAELTQ